MNTPVLTHFLNGFLMLAIPIGLAVLLTRLWKLGWRIWWIGCATFILSQIGHVPFNLLVGPFFENTGFSQLNPTIQQIIQAAFLGVSAGIFEEGARYLVLRFWAKDARSWGRGILFGAGHGGAEAIILGVLVVYGFIQMWILRNATNQEITNIVGSDNLAIAQAQIQAYWSISWQESLLGVVERVFTLPCQIAMAILVMQVFTRKNILWLLAAIGFHALIDGTVVFALPSLSIWELEGLVALFAFVSLIIILLLRQPEPMEIEVKSSQKKIPKPRVKPVDETPENIDNSRYQS